MIPLQVTNEDVAAITICLICMGLDILSGVLAAAINHDLQSTKIREGLGHKATLVIFIVLALVIQEGVLRVPSLGWQTPLLTPVCVVIIAMEVVSIVENLIKAYPELENSKLVQMFHKEDNNG